MDLILTSRPVQIKETPSNRRAPVINPRIQEQLTRIGGTVPEGGGDYAGQPVYRLAFGQEEKHFSRGKMRIRFIDDDVEPVFVQERFFVSPEVFARAAEWQTAREKERFDRFLNCDYSIFAENKPISSYLKQNESSLDYMQLADACGSREEVSGNFAGIAASAAPADWIYLCDVKEIVEIGKNCWFVMRWIPASSHGGKKQWNEMRYTRDAYVPELNTVVPLVDDLGAFPENGFWIPRLQIAEFPEDENGNLHPTNYEYTEPTEANCVLPVIEMLYERARLTNQDKDRAWRAKRSEEQLYERQQSAIAAQERAAEEFFGVEVEPVMGGRASVFQS